MADLPEVDEWTPGIYQLETSDPVLGGPDGIDNLQGKQLASRTRWLFNALQKLVNGVTIVGKAARLETARVLKFKGAASGNGSFDGSSDIEITLTLPNTGVAAGAYSKVTLNEKGLVISGSNPTSLAGYGITDALPNLNPLPYGSLDLHGANFAHVTSPAETSLGQNCYFDGTNWVRHDVGRPAISVGLSNNKLSVLRVSAGPNPINWETISTSLDTSNALFSYLKEVPTTLAGYGITDAVKSADKASQEDVEAGVSDSKWVTPKGVFQALAKAITQATEFAFGWAKIATRGQVNAGTDDNTIVTPKKLRFGFLISLGNTGFVAFPEFLGGVILQWGSAAVPGGAEGADIVMPLAFPNAALGLWPMWLQTSQVTSTAPTFMGHFPSTTAYRIMTNQPAGNYGITWISIGY